MSIRIGLYDFFAYTLPGMLYVAIVGFWLSTLGLVRIDPLAVTQASALVVLILAGVGYVSGLLLDTFAYGWIRFFHPRNQVVTKAAFEQFARIYPAWTGRFTHNDWGILLRAIKSKSLEAAMDVEQHNVAAIMLRNISLGLLLTAISFVVVAFLDTSFGWNLVWAAAAIGFSIVAMRRSQVRRNWFYLAIFQAFAAQFLLDDVLLDSGRSRPASTEPGLDRPTATRSQETDELA